MSRAGFALLAVLLVISCSCSTLSRDQYLVCSYDSVWDAALTAVKDRAATVKDKERGLIETAWLEIPMPGRTYGAIRRDLVESKDRSRLNLLVKRMNEVTMVSILEQRESWAFRGGERLWGWVPTEPSDEVLSATQDRLDVSLKEHGCSAT